MSGIPVVKDLQGLLKKTLEPGEKVVNCDVSRLTAPGENYGSVMLRIIVQIENASTGTQRNLDTVAKIVPENELVQEVFNTGTTFRNEYQFYAQIVPLLDNFLESKGISSGTDFAAPFHGGRLNLKGTEIVDADAVILMKNLKSEDYVIGKKSEGIDIQSAQIVLNAFAQLHATGLAFRKNNPKEFDEKIRPFFYGFMPTKELDELVYNALVQTLEDVGFSKTEIERAKLTYKQDSRKKNVSDLWGTMIHCDSWTNNLLIKYTKTHQPIHCIIVDFQIFDYGTPLNDVMFFLFSSIQQHLLLDYLDPLLEYYYKQLISGLQKIGVDTQPFTKKSFDDEVKKAVKYYEYYHTMWMLEPIMHEQFKSVDDLHSIEGYTTRIGWSEEHINKIKTITRLCIDRDWI